MSLLRGKLVALIVQEVEMLEVVMPIINYCTSILLPSCVNNSLKALRSEATTLMKFVFISPSTC